MKNENDARIKTIYDIARKTGVSASTVSLVLNGKGRINAATRQRVLKVVAESDYIPNKLARKLRKRRTDSLGVVIDHFHNRFFTSMFDGIEHAISERGFTFLAAESRENPEKERREIKLMAEHGVDGLIVFPCSDDPSYLTTANRHYQIPFVLVGNCYEGYSFPAVVADNRTGARLATERLLSLNRRTIIHIAGPQQQTMCKDRKAAFISTVIEGVAELSAASYCVIDVNDLSVGEGYRAMAKVKEQLPFPVSVFAVNDETAFGVIKYCNKEGLRIPEDVAVVGFSDVDLIDDLQLGLSSIRIPAHEMGRRAADLLLECLFQNASECPPRHIELPVELVERRSTLS